MSRPPGPRGSVEGAQGAAAARQGPALIALERRQVRATRRNRFGPVARACRKSSRRTAWTRRSSRVAQARRRARSRRTSSSQPAGEGAGQGLDGGLLRRIGRGGGGETVTLGIAGAHSLAGKAARTGAAPGIGPVGGKPGRAAGRSAAQAASSPPCRSRRGMQGRRGRIATAGDVGFERDNGPAAVKIAQDAGAPRLGLRDQTFQALHRVDRPTSVSAAIALPWGSASPKSARR